MTSTNNDFGPRNYFQPSETECRCGCGLDIKPLMRAALNTIREQVGQPLHITSGARCPSHNKNIGGASRSKHLEGLAADIACTDDALRWKIVDAATGLGMRLEWGTSTWVHVDLGTPPLIFHP